MQPHSALRWIFLLTHARQQIHVVLVASTAGIYASSLHVTWVGRKEQAKTMSGSSPPAQTPVPPSSPQGFHGFTLNVAALVGVVEQFEGSLQYPS